MIRFEFHRRPLSLMLVREATPINHRYDVERDLWRPVYKHGLRWDRAIGLRAGYFPEQDSLGVQVMLWRKSFGAWIDADFQMRRFLRTEPLAVLRRAPIFWRRMRFVAGVGAPF